MDWKVDFLKLYTSDLASDFGEALDLKRKNLPKKLYRYRSLSDETIKHRFAEIVRGELFMSHPKDLNDPFEACSHLSSTDPASYMIDKATYEEQFAGKIPEDKYKEIFSGENWFDLLIAYVAETIPNQESVERNKKILEEVTLHGMKLVNARMSETARSMVRLVSFSTTPTNLPMWHHYTGAHRGICLEYDTDAITDVYQKNMLFPVYYVDMLPDVASMMLRNTHPKFSLFEYIAMHKLKDWEYEKEWRLLHDAGSWYYSPDDVPEEFYTNGKSIQFIRPSKIILGVRISEAHRAQIEKMASIANVPVVQAQQTEYGLNIE